MMFTGREGCVLNTAHLALVLPWATGCVWSHCLLQKVESVIPQLRLRGVD